jgi:hypothetical protein
MSKIDLDKLIVRLTYFIPIESSKLASAIKDELNRSDKSVGGVLPWDMDEKHGLSFRFSLSFKHFFLSDSVWGKKKGTEEYNRIMEEKKREFEEKGSEIFYDMLENVREDLVATIDVRAITKEKNGCLCNVEGAPILHKKLIYGSEVETNDFMIQNAYLECKRFLEIIFESGLLATLVTEEKKIPAEKNTQFLANDQSSHEILDKIETMLDQATGEILICAWIGTILLPKLKEAKQKGINIRIITHKAIELKGEQGRQDAERAYQELLLLIDKDHISIRPECHFRVLVVDDKALVGSMDLNATSLTGTHREFAIYTEIPEVVIRIRNYFNHIFTPLKE